MLWLVVIDGVVQWARVGPQEEIKNNPNYTGQKNQEEAEKEVKES